MRLVAAAAANFKTIQQEQCCFCRLGPCSTCLKLLCRSMAIVAAATATAAASAAATTTSTRDKKKPTDTRRGRCC